MSLTEDGENTELHRGEQNFGIPKAKDGLQDLVGCR